MRRPLPVPALLAVLLCAACADGSGPTPSAGQGTPSSRVSAEPTLEPSASSLTPSPDVAGSGTALGAELEPPLSAARNAGLEPQGAVDAISWVDRNGRNFLVLREGSNASALTLAADLVAQAEDGTRVVLRQVRDAEEFCGQAVTAEFGPGSMSVLVDDGDGIGEVTFAYRAACRGDVSPAGQNLLVLEGKDKYILRGQTSVSFDGPAPEPEPEPEPAAWPAGVFERAMRSWQALPAEF